VANRVSREKIEEMFRVYIDRESIEEVATKCGVSHRTAERYRVLERWTERLVEIRRKAQAEADYTIVDAMADSLRTIRSYKGKLAAAIERKTVTTDEVSAADLERLVRLEAFVLGAAESRHEVVAAAFAVDWTEEEREHFARTGERPDRSNPGTPRNRAGSGS
jgi:DNA replicative helicase MCM subunit Mcm2 (Cdc46/Mcm family)